MENPPPQPGVLLTCPACKSPVEPGHKFCPICGAKIPELPVCRNCGAQFIAPVKFCEMCGTPVTPAGVPAIPHEEQEVPEPGPAYEPEPVVETIHEPEEIHAPEPGPAYEPEPVVETIHEPEEIHPPEPRQEFVHPEPVAPKPAIVTPEPAPKPSRPADRDTSSGGTGVSGTDPLSPAFSGLSDLPKTTAPSPKKSSRNSALIAGAIVILLVIAGAAYFVGLPLLAGIVMPPGGAAPDQVPSAPVATHEPEPAAPAGAKPPTPVPASTPTAEDTSPAPIATQLMPEKQVVYFDVQKDQVSGDITVIYQRGPGENILNFAEIKVTYPDGSVKTGRIKPSNGDTELVLEGSKATDRVEVIAYMHNGQSYRIKDELMAFQPLRET